MWLRYDGTPYYVGKGTKNRAWRRGSPPFERVLVQEFPTEQDALEAEIFLISYYGRKDLKTGQLINHTDGGEGVSGWERSVEWRENQRQSMTGRTKSPEVRKKISDGQLGNKRGEATRRLLSEKAKLRENSTEHMNTPEARAKKSMTLTGRPFTKEHRANISASCVGRIPWNKGKQHSPETKAKIRLKALARRGEV